MAKRIGIISDTHGVIRPEMIEILRTCDCIFHAGDVCRPELLDQIRPLGALYAVQGNNDRYWAQPLAKTLAFTIEGVRFFMVHDVRDVGRGLKDAQVIIYGHTHRYSMEERDGRLWLNPGSSGKNTRGTGETMAVMTVENGSWQVEKIVFQMFE